MAKTAVDIKKSTFTSKMGLNLSTKLIKCYIWSIALHGAAKWTLRKVQKHLESCEMWRWRRMEKISWTYRMKNEVLHVVSEERNIAYNGKRRKNCLLKRAIEGVIRKDR